MITIFIPLDNFISNFKNSKYLHYTDIQNELLTIISLLPNSYYYFHLNSTVPL
jgi:hypothetical protein